jgi:hypothetical protein
LCKAKAHGARRAIAGTAEAEPSDNSIGRLAVDGHETLRRAVIRIHVSGWDIEPPRAQPKRPGQDPIANDCVGGQVFQLHQNIELRELVVRFEAGIEPAFVFQPNCRRFRVAKPLVEIWCLRSLAFRKDRLHGPAFGMAAYDG